MWEDAELRPLRNAVREAHVLVAAVCRHHPCRGCLQGFLGPVQRAQHHRRELPTPLLCPSKALVLCKQGCQLCQCPCMRLLAALSQLGNGRAPALALASERCMCPTNTSSTAASLHCPAMLIF